MIPAIGAVTSVYCRRTCLGPLRGGGRLHVLGRLHLAAAERDLLRVRSSQSDRCALGLHLLVEGVELRLCRVECRPGLVELLRRNDILLRQVLGSGVGGAGVLEIGRRSLDLRFSRGEHGFSLRDLISELALLKAKRSFRLAHLRRQAFDVLRVIRGVCLELVWLQNRDELVFLDIVALFDEELRNLPANLGADDDVVGRYDAGERQRRGRAIDVRVGPVARCGGKGNDEERSKSFHTVRLSSNKCIKHLFEACQQKRREPLKADWFPDRF